MSPVKNEIHQKSDSLHRDGSVKLSARTVEMDVRYERGLGVDHGTGSPGLAEDQYFCKAIVVGWDNCQEAVECSECKCRGAWRRRTDY
jgi:hypothetical protein